MGTMNWPSGVFSAKGTRLLPENNGLSRTGNRDPVFRGKYLDLPPGPSGGAANGVRVKEIPRVFLFFPMVRPNQGSNFFTLHIPGHDDSEFFREHDHEARPVPGYNGNLPAQLTHQYLDQLHPERGSTPEVEIRGKADPVIADLEREPVVR